MNKSNQRKKESQRVITKKPKEKHKNFYKIIKTKPSKESLIL